MPIRTDRAAWRYSNRMKKREFDSEKLAFILFRLYKQKILVLVIPVKACYNVSKYN